MSHKSFKIKLEINNKQEGLFIQHAGVARHAYNQGLAHCNDLFKNGEKIPSAIDLHKWLVEVVKKENTWYYNSSKCSPQQALRDLQNSFKNFHRIQKESGYKLLHTKIIKGKKEYVGLQGLPTFKKKNDKDSIYLEGCIHINSNYIKLPRIGWVKLAEKINIDSIKNCRISKKANGWFISFKANFIPKYICKKYNSVGVDLGIKTLATLSSGEYFDNIKPYKNAKLKLRKQQKEVSRKYKKGAKNQSSNYKKAVVRFLKTNNTIVNIRKDYLHKITTYLAKNYEVVVIENLSVKTMIKRHRISSELLDAGFYEFKRQLLYKKEWYGGSLIIANQYFPSSKLCSCCGHKKDSLKLSERNYNCEKCFIVLDRDYNASLNLNNLAVSSTVSAFGNNSFVDKSTQLIDELGIKHQMFTFE